MNILKSIKAWWKPDVKEASTKATVRFKNGVAFSTTIPANAGFDMRNKVDGFKYRNQDRDATAKIHSVLATMQRQQAIGIMNNPNGQSGQAMQGNMLMDPPLTMQRLRPEHIMGRG